MRMLVFYIFKGKIVCLAYLHIQLKINLKKAFPPGAGLTNAIKQMCFAHFRVIVKISETLRQAALKCKFQNWGSKTISYNLLGAHIYYLITPPQCGCVCISEGVCVCGCVCVGVCGCVCGCVGVWVGVSECVQVYERLSNLNPPLPPPTPRDHCPMMVVYDQLPCQGHCQKY